MGNAAFFNILLPVRKNIAVICLSAGHHLLVSRNRKIFRRAVNPLGNDDMHVAAVQNLPGIDNLGNRSCLLREKHSQKEKDKFSHPSLPHLLISSCLYIFENRK
ncbi:unknown [Proteobacteria bacterium CAG:495]|nr:unknown [Proteobacteria bacterium CAG:495]